ncbi:hypothetical protein pipiens_003824 [Culex pipiens pipiens]|uniref:Uncharacterized protein n=1 Tax=Culex pipiens pipiens TaxID=38569 RepID=A0ABD1CSE2_CULPP
MNEKFAVQILPYEKPIVDMVLIQLVYMEENLASTNKNEMLYIAHRMEVERIRYLLVSYHQTTSLRPRPASICAKSISRSTSTTATFIMQKKTSHIEKDIFKRYVPSKQRKADQKNVDEEVLSS